MPESVKLPVVGPVSRRALLIGGGASALLVGLIWYRKRQADQSAAAAAVDPNAADLGAGLDAVDSGTGSGAAGGGAGGAGNGAVPVDQVATNAQWSALVTQSLSGVVDPSVLAQAIGLYLTGSAVTRDQELVIDQAIAFAGYPPVAGPAGYPPAIRQTPGGGQSTPPPDSGFVQGGRNVQGYFEAWNRHDPTLHLTYKRFLALNPEAAGNIQTYHNASGADDSFIHDATYRLR